MHGPLKGEKPDGDLFIPECAGIVETVQDVAGLVSVVVERVRSGAEEALGIVRFAQHLHASAEIGQEQTGPFVGRLHTAGEAVLVVLGERHQRSAELTEIVGRSGAAGGQFGLRQGGSGQGRKQADERDGDEQLDERKTGRRTGLHIWAA